MSTLDAIGAAVARELALPDVDTLTTIVVRVLVAALLGGIVGWEREHKGRAAGLKTHILVSIGSALFVLAPLLSGIDGAEVTRVMQGIVSGIGFLGAGAILKLGKDERIEGLTTAAGVWMTAAIGMAAGMGQEMVALVTTLVAMLVVGAVPRVQRRDPRVAHDLQAGKQGETPVDLRD
ncbi:methyltransferase [Lysobacteraceae bacterium NML93-0399]|nr:methyltransferase [Xanthomonadaceae bacterium NML93-0399]